jgi:gamma-glutamylcyclotransferase (GGCT)/AIG2-like uncharacterized protein YtfP
MVALLESLDWLFAYGTLGPDPAGTTTPCWIPDAVQGRLFQTDEFPLLIDHDDPAAGWVRGHVALVAFRDLVTELDRYEGLEDHLFQRVRVLTRARRKAWLYVWPRKVPEYARGPIPSWNGPRVSWAGFSSLSSDSLPRIEL